MSGVYDGIMQGLEEALEHARGKRELRSNSVSVVPLKDFEPAEIREIRVSLGMTQVVFADSIGVSPKTVEAWETGRNKPIGPARRILSMVQSDPNVLKQFVRSV